MPVLHTIGRCHFFIMQMEEAMHLSSLAGLYDSVNKVYINEYSPAKVVILNNSPEMRKYKIVAEIMGVSYRFINEIIIEPYKAGNVRIAPKLIEEKIENIFTNTDYDMLVQVFDSSSNLLYEETKECLIYPREVFVDVLKNKTKDWRLDLRFFLARWVSPTNVLIDRIISDAGNAKHHPIKGISNATNDAIQEEMKCIYDYLSERINYIALPLAFAEGDYHAQRVALPSTTLKNKSGNCIDLSVLLASCFEALKLHTYIILVPGHAFLKVGLRGEIVFLESTYMGGHPYYEATQKARETYYKYFTNTSQPTMKGCYEIDLEIARKSRIFPME